MTYAEHNGSLVPGNMPDTERCRIPKYLRTYPTYLTFGHRPDQRLDAILNLRPPFKDLPFTELDALYRHIISKAEDPSTVLDILCFPLLYGEFDVLYLEKILQLEEGDVEVMLADLQSLVTIDRKTTVFDPKIKVELLHKSLGDFLCDSQRAGNLYQDLSAVRGQHITRLISMVNTTFKHRGLQALDSDMAPWLHAADKVLAPIQQEPYGTIHNLNGEKARYFSSEFLQAASEFPTFDLVKKMNTNPPRHRSRYIYLFLSCYLTFLRSVKDVQESARKIYLQQIRQYCEAVLSLLEDDFPNDWEAHFMYSSYHLLRPRLRRHSIWQSLHVRQFLPLEDDNFGDFIYHISSSAEVVPGSRSFNNYLGDILEISNDLTKGAKRDAIFALSACFCLAFLCINRITALDARHIFKAMGIDQRRRREHPWCWRRMISRRCSLGNQPVIMEFGPYIGSRSKEWHERLGNMRKASRNAGIYSDSVIKNKIYTIPEFLHINKHRRDTWLREEIDIHRQPIHSKRNDKPYVRLPAQYRRKQEWPLYMLLLDLLPRILSLSGRYEPLVTICRTKCLASLSRCWPKKSRRARQAIETYLQRMDLEENK
ncbi:hypothetical protein CPC08DRAFT_728006 [Agrocybe pediades]|nr:hypothetical protein CPC08DRAFT_728006 [Agrocybe pediades]